MNAATLALSPGEIASLLDSIRSAITAEVNAASDTLLAWHPAPGEWCAKACIGHIVEAERRGFNGRIRVILSQSDPQLPGWDQQVVERERNDCERSAADLLQEFTAIRTDSVSLVRNLTAADLSRGGTHEKVGYVTVQNLLNEWVHHDRNHFRQLQANLQAYVWPAMGNCQKFVNE